MYRRRVEVLCVAREKRTSMKETSKQTKKCCSGSQASDKTDFGIAKKENEDKKIHESNKARVMKCGNRYRCFVFGKKKISMYV